ncbi:MAG: hypothetical protein MJ078_01155 [Clostridia bacterium]|nr:hypothetical protein [Clostridia bacterium]
MKEMKCSVLRSVGSALKKHPALSVEYDMTFGYYETENDNEPVIHSQKQGKFRLDVAKTIGILCLFTVVKDIFRIIKWVKKR